MTRPAKILLGLALVLCFFQFPRSIDLKGYLIQAGQSAADGFQTPPYPKSEAKLGDFFQSPIVLVLLVPLAKLPPFVAKLLYALLSAALVVWAFRIIVTGPVNGWLALFLFLVFSHPLSDVFLSANINFMILCLLLAGWRLSESSQWKQQALGGLAIGLAVLIKVQPLIFVVWFLVRGNFRAVGWAFSGIAAWVALTFVFLPGAIWWAQWWQALPLYSQAAFPGALAYQSPPAAFFRLLFNRGWEFAPAWKATGLFALALQGALFVAAWVAQRRNAGRPVVFAILLSAFFLGVPFSWAQTVLFCFPLLYLAVQDGPSRAYWVIATILALIPKAFWPEPIWNDIANRSLPALCLMALFGLALFRLMPRRVFAEFRP